MTNAVLVCCVILAVAARGIWCIKATLTAAPSVVKRGEDVVLHCTYDLEGAPLYTVKYYRYTSEFYRYNPSDASSKMNFPAAGISVDLSYSNESQVMLRSVDFITAGMYTCEVSADAPSFRTIMANAHLDVVVPPKRDPVLKTEADKYEIGDTLRANCTSSPSRPAVNLTLLINNQVLSLAKVQVHHLDNNMEFSDVAVSMPITPNYYRGGRMTIRCVAQLHPVYAESATLVFISMKQEPSWQRRLSSGAFSNSVSLIILLVSLLCVFGFDYENLFYNDVYEDDVKKPEIEI